MPQGAHLRLHGLPGDHCQAEKTHCPAGHPYDEANTYPGWKGERQCRTLPSRERRRAAYHRNLEASREKGRTYQRERWRKLHAEKGRVL